MATRNQRRADIALDHVRARAHEVLLARQHPDGGWSYTPRNTDSFVEPTAWAILALQDNPTAQRALETAARFIDRARNEDGGWPNVPGMPSDMTTARVVFALDGRASGPQAAAGADWIQQHEIPTGGWGWCQGTTGFIETAAYAIIALSAADRLTDPARHRDYVRGLACNGGGWNSHTPGKLGHNQAPLRSVTPLGLIALTRLGAHPDTCDVARDALRVISAPDPNQPTPYSSATRLWALAETGLEQEAMDTALALDTNGPHTWTHNTLHTAIIGHAAGWLDALRRTETGPDA